MFDEGCIHGCVLLLWGIIDRVWFKGINYGFKLEIPDQMKLSKNYLDNTPLLALIAANVVPLFGAVFWDWNTFNIVFLYWAENLAVGFYTILKIVFIPVPDPAKRLSLGAFLVKTCLIVPFIIHYGGFISIHCLIILTFFRNEKAGSVMSPYMTGALVALFLSHGVSFVRNYLIKREYKERNLWQLMIRGPYSRIVIMHLAVFAGGWGVMTLGSPLGGLVVLIALKTAIDARTHLREHQKVKPHEDSFDSTSHIETEQIRKEYPYVSSSSGSLFHRSEEPCAEKLLPENLIGFDSRADAIDKGYRPCSKCRP